MTLLFLCYLTRYYPYTLYLYKLDLVYTSKEYMDNIVLDSKEIVS